MCSRSGDTLRKNSWPWLGALWHKNLQKPVLIIISLTIPVNLKILQIGIREPLTETITRHWVCLGSRQNPHAPLLNLPVDLLNVRLIGVANPKRRYSAGTYVAKKKSEARTFSSDSLPVIKGNLGWAWMIYVPMCLLLPSATRFPWMIGQIQTNEVQWHKQILCSEMPDRHSDNPTNYTGAITQEW